MPLLWSSLRAEGEADLLHDSGFANSVFLEHQLEEIASTPFTAITRAMAQEQFMTELGRSSSSLRAVGGLGLRLMRYNKALMAPWLSSPIFLRLAPCWRHATRRAWPRSRPQWRNSDPRESVGPSFVKASKKGFHQPQTLRGRRHLGRRVFAPFDLAVGDRDQTNSDSVADSRCSLLKLANQATRSRWSRSQSGT